MKASWDGHERTMGYHGGRYRIIIKAPWNHHGKAMEAQCLSDSTMGITIEAPWVHLGSTMGSRRRHHGSNAMFPWKHHEIKMEAPPWNHSESTIEAPWKHNSSMATLWDTIEAPTWKRIHPLKHHGVMPSPRKHHGVTQS